MQHGFGQNSVSYDPQPGADTGAKVGHEVLSGFVAHRMHDVNQVQEHAEAEPAGDALGTDKLRILQDVVDRRQVRNAPQSRRERRGTRGRKSMRVHQVNIPAGNLAVHGSRQRYVRAIVQFDESDLQRREITLEALHLVHARTQQAQVHASQLLHQKRINVLKMRPDAP